MLKPSLETLAAPVTIDAQADVLSRFEDLYFSDEPSSPQYFQAKRDQNPKPINSDILNILPEQVPVKKLAWMPKKSSDQKTTKGKRPATNKVYSQDENEHVNLRRVF